MSNNGNALALIRPLAVALLVAGTALIGAPSAQAAPPVAVVTDQAACLAELTANGTGNSLNKSIDDVVDNGDGTYTVEFTYTSTRPNGTYQVRDCAFVDSNGNGDYDLTETITATPQTSVALVGGTGTSQITVTAEPGDSICDRFVLAGSGPPNFTHRSEIVCADTSDTEVPVGAIGGLGLAALAALAFGAVVLFKRGRTVRA